VVATLYTHRRALVVKLEGRVVKRFACPIPEPVVPPLYPLPRGRCQRPRPRPPRSLRYTVGRAARPGGLPVSLWEDGKLVNDVMAHEAT